MERTYKTVLVYLCVVLAILIIIFLVNQTAGIVQIASSISPGFGRAALYIMLGFFILALVVPIVSILRFPKPLTPPKEEEGEEYEEYRRRLGARLQGNPFLAGYAGDLQTPQGIEGAFKILDREATDTIQRTASAIFVSTAVSQNGQLDALMVLFAQSRLIADVARIYWQRPTARELIRLYLNVGATVFLVRQIDDLEIGEQIEPIVTAAISGSLASQVPGIGMAAILVTDAILQGTANAFLTLRIGAITRQYCAPLARRDRSAIRRFASLEAATMLGGIVAKSAGAVSKAIFSAARKAGASTVGSVVHIIPRPSRRRPPRTE